MHTACTRSALTRYSRRGLPSAPLLCVKNSSDTYFSCTAAFEITLHMQPGVSEVASAQQLLGACKHRQLCCIALDFRVCSMQAPLAREAPVDILAENHGVSAVIGPPRLPDTRVTWHELFFVR